MELKIIKHTRIDMRTPKEKREQNKVLKAHYERTMKLYWEEESRKRNQWDLEQDLNYTNTKGNK